MYPRTRSTFCAGLILIAAGSLAAPASAGIIGLCGNNGWGHRPRWVPPGTGASHDAGRSVDIDGTTAVVGAPGGDAVHIYERQGSTGAFAQTLEDSPRVGD